MKLQGERVPGKPRWHLQPQNTSTRNGWGRQVALRVPIGRRDTCARHGTRYSATWSCPSSRAPPCSSLPNGAGITCIRNATHDTSPHLAPGTLHLAAFTFTPATLAVRPSVLAAIKRGQETCLAAIPPSALSRPFAPVPHAVSKGQDSENNPYGMACCLAACCRARRRFVSLLPATHPPSSPTPTPTPYSPTRTRFQDCLVFYAP